MPPSFPGRPCVRQRPPGCRSRDRNHRWRPHDRADGATAVTDDRAVVRRPLPPRRRRVRVAAADPPLPPPWRRGAPGTRALPANGPPRRRGQHPAAIRIKVARADEDLIAVVECSHANGDRSEDLLFPHPRSIAGREQTPTTLTRTPLDPASGPTRVGVPLVPSRCLLVGGPGPRKPKTPPRRGLDQRSLLVGVAGFEPTASSSRTKRAAKLRYTPEPPGRRPPAYRTCRVIVAHDPRRAHAGIPGIRATAAGAGGRDHGSSDPLSGG